MDINSTCTDKYTEIHVNSQFSYTTSHLFNINIVPGCCSYLSFCISQWRFLVAWKTKSKLSSEPLLTQRKSTVTCLSFCYIPCGWCGKMHDKKQNNSVLYSQQSHRYESEGFILFHFNQTTKFNRKYVFFLLYKKSDWKLSLLIKYQPNILFSSKHSWWTVQMYRIHVGMRQDNQLWEQDE